MIFLFYLIRDKRNNYSMCSFTVYINKYLLNFITEGNNQ